MGEKTKEELEKENELLKQQLATTTIRKRGPSPYADELAPVGSREYWRRYREVNKERVKLYQKRYYEQQRKIALAAELAAGKAAATNTKPDLQEALKELDQTLDSIKQAREEAVEDGTIAPRGAVPFVVEQAERLGVSYKEAEKFILSPHYKKGSKEELDEFAKDQLSKLGELPGIQSLLDEEEKETDGK